MSIYLPGVCASLGLEPCGCAVGVANLIMGRRRRKWRPSLSASTGSRGGTSATSGRRKSRFSSSTACGRVGGWGHVGLGLGLGF